ncbi:MAG: tautomerase family protein [Lachnospiraceae bacterium]
MPIVNIQISAGRSREEKQGLMAGIKLALIEVLGLSEESCYIYLDEFEPENSIIPTGKHQNMTIKISCFAGRSVDKKQEIFSRLAEHLKKNGQPDEQLVMVICDPDRDNWGIPPFS